MSEYLCRLPAAVAAAVIVFGTLAGIAAIGAAEYLLLAAVR